MPTNQEARQASVRSVTGTAYFLDNDWMALFASAGITTGFFNERQLAWINGYLSTSYTNINDARHALAVNQGFRSWNEMGAFTATTTPGVAGILDFSDNTNSAHVATIGA